MFHVKHLLNSWYINNHAAHITIPIAGIVIFALSIHEINNPRKKMSTILIQDNILFFI